MASNDDLVAALRDLTEPRWRCVICDQIFLHPEPHWCLIGFIKKFARVAKRHQLLTIWKPVYEEENGNENV